MENEIMNTIEETIENTEMPMMTETSCGFGKGVLVGGSVVAGLYGLYKLTRKAIDYHKSKKEQPEENGEFVNLEPIEDSDDVE